MAAGLVTQGVMPGRIPLLAVIQAIASQGDDIIALRQLDVTGNAKIKQDSQVRSTKIQRISIHLGRQRRVPQLNLVAMGTKFAHGDCTPVTRSA